MGNGESLTIQPRRQQRAETDDETGGMNDESGVVQCRLQNGGQIGGTDTVKQLAAHHLHIRPRLAQTKAGKTMNLHRARPRGNHRLQLSRQGFAAPARAGRLLAKAALDANHDGVHAAIES
jgi:hypothetical protein